MDCRARIPGPVSITGNVAGRVGVVEVAVVLLLCLLIPAGHGVHAEAASAAGSELLIEALADRTYERRTYTVDGVLDGRATLRVGAL